MTMAIIEATGANVRNAVAAARRLAGIKHEDSQEVLRSGGEDNLYRVHLKNGQIVEVTVKSRARSSAKYAGVK